MTENLILGNYGGQEKRERAGVRVKSGSALGHMEKSLHIFLRREHWGIWESGKGKR